MVLEEFGERAREYVRLSERAGSEKDRDLFLALARAWYGVASSSNTENQDVPIKVTPKPNIRFVTNFHQGGVDA